MRMIADLVLPVRCAGCATRGTAWCAACAAGLGAPFALDLPGTGPPAYAVTRYRGPARRAVLACKERNRRDLAAPIGARLGAVLPDLPHVGPADDGYWYLVPAPSRPAASRRRGAWHLRAIARHAAARLAADGRPAAVAAALRLHRGARDSVGLDAAARSANLRGRLRTRPDGLPPPGSRVVLLDDVITTGATVAACSAVLEQAGMIVAGALAFTAVPPGMTVPTHPFG